VKFSALDMERFFTKVDFNGPTTVGTPCWSWEGSRNEYGYGQFWFEDRILRAHHFTFEMAYGKLPEGMLVMHRCDNPWCVNPTHLRAGTDKENAEDCVAKGRAASRKKRKLTPEQRREIGRLEAAGVPRREIAHRLNVCGKTVRVWANRAKESEKADDKD